METPTMEVRARLTAETAQFTKGIQQATQTMNNFSQQSSRLRGAMLGIGVAAGVAGASVIAFSQKAFMAAARVDELDVAMNAVGKSTGLGYYAIRDAAVAIKDMGIEMGIAQQSAIKFAQNNLDLAYASKLARAAQDLAVVSGMNSTDTYNMLTHAVITGRSEVLKSVGIQKSAGQMYEEYAKSIGKSANALTYQEKQQATATGALKEAEKVAGAYEAAMDSPGKVLRSFARLHNEIQVSIGNVLLKAFGPMIKGLYDFEKYVSKALEKSKVFKIYLDAMSMVLTKLTKPVTDFLGKLKEWAEGFTKVAGSADEARSKATQILPSVTAIAEKMEMLLPVLAAVTAGFATFAGRGLLQNLPIIGNLLTKLSPLPVALVVLALTSSQVRNALINLFSAFSPLLPVIMQLGKIASAVGVVGVAVLAKGINMLAAAVRGIIGFVQRNIELFKNIAKVLAVVLIGYAAYRTALLVTAAATAVWAAVTTGATAVVNGLRTAMAILNATMAFNPIPLVIGLVIALMSAFGYLIATNEKVAEVVGKVFNFIVRVVINVFSIIVQAVGYVLKAFGSLVNGYNYIVKANIFVAETIAHVFGYIVGAVADLMGVFNKLFSGLKGVFLGIVDGIHGVGKGVFGILGKIADGVGGFLGWVFEKMTAWVRGLLGLFGKIPKIGPMVSDALTGGLDAAQKVVEGFAKSYVGIGEKVFDGVIAGAKTAINVVSGIGTGIEKGLRTTEGFLKGFSLDGISNFVQMIADKSTQAGEFLIGFAGTMREFGANTDFAGAIGDGISNLIDKVKGSLKEGLGFGDVLAEEKKKYSEASGLGSAGDKAAEDAAKAADRLKSIREAMQAGIDSIKGVLDDLRKAAGDFANSLKDTIVGFAGIKGIELPDGFIPKAKSLIENMRTRLDKANQFGLQIAALQAQGLDASALQDIIEAGPLKGAQIAASILAGGDAAVKEINNLQRAIQFSGAAIGQYGSQAAFGGLITDAQSQLSRITDAELATRASGTNQYIQQGAFQVVVNTSGAANTEEEIKMITDKIEQTFAILARELAAK